jgi:hypothetical protein
MAFQQLTLSQVSLVKTPSGITEIYIPLWVYSSGTAGTTASGYAQKGSTTITSTATNATTLHTLNTSWFQSQKFALEGSIYISNSAGTAYLQLVDLTTSSGVPNATISTTSTTATLLRSGTFTLTPGHKYGLQLSSNVGSYTAYLTKAHLIAFLS